MVYKWKLSQSQYKCDAQVAGEFMENLTNTVGLSAETLVDASREENTPLHSEFEWDDAVAGEEYRKSQARELIRMICVVSEHETNEPCRAFFTVQRGTPYEPTEVIIQNADKRQALLKQALSELKAFEMKYQMLTELAEIFNAIERVETKEC